MKKLSRLAVMLALVLALTACSGGADTPSPDEQTEGQHPVTDAAELEGQWTSPSGNILSFSADQGRYTYQTFSGDHTSTVQCTICNLIVLCFLINFLSAIHKHTNNTTDHDGCVQIDWKIKTDCKRHYRNS